MKIHSWMGKFRVYILIFMVRSNRVSLLGYACGLGLTMCFCSSGLNTFVVARIIWRWTSDTAAVVNRRHNVELPVASYWRSWSLRGVDLVWASNAIWNETKSFTNWLVETVPPGISSGKYSSNPGLRYRGRCWISIIRTLFRKDGENIGFVMAQTYIDTWKGKGKSVNNDPYQQTGNHCPWKKLTFPNHDGGLSIKNKFTFAGNTFPCSANINLRQLSTVKFFIVHPSIFAKNPIPWPYRIRSCWNIWSMTKIRLSIIYDTSVWWGQYRLGRIINIWYPSRLSRPGHGKSVRVSSWSLSVVADRSKCLTLTFIRRFKERSTSKLWKCAIRRICTLVSFFFTSISFLEMVFHLDRINVNAAISSGVSSSRSNRLQTEEKTSRLTGPNLMGPGPRIVSRSCCRCSSDFALRRNILWDVNTTTDNTNGVPWQRLYTLVLGLGICTGFATLQIRKRTSTVNQCDPACLLHKGSIFQQRGRRRRHVPRCG